MLRPTGAQVSVPPSDTVPLGHATHAPPSS